MRDLARNKLRSGTGGSFPLSGGCVSVQRRDVVSYQPVKALVGVDGHAKRESALKHDEAMDRAEQSADRMRRLISLESVLAHDGEDGADELLSHSAQLRILR